MLFRSLAALLVAGLMVRLVWLRVGLAAMGWLLALYVLPFELDGSALVAAWSALGAAGMVIFQRVIAPRLPDSFREAGVPSLRIPASVAPTVTSLVVRLSEIARPLFLGAACLASAAAIAHLVAFEYPPDRIGTGLAGTPDRKSTRLNSSH